MKRRARIPALLLALVFLSGCGSPEGSVTGTVTFRGAPVTTGHVNFFDPNRGTGARGELDASGNFALEGTLPPGTYQVYVTPPSPAPPRADVKAPPRKPQPFVVSKKYTAAQTSGLTVTVNPGPNSFPIDLPD